MTSTSSTDNQMVLSGFLIVKLALRVLGVAIAGMARSGTFRSVKRKSDSVQFRLVCGSWVCRFTIRPSVPSRSRSNRSATTPMADPSSIYTEITLPETDRRVGDVSSYHDEYVSELMPFDKPASTAS